MMPSHEYLLRRLMNRKRRNLSNTQRHRGACSVQRNVAFLIQYLSAHQKDWPAGKISILTYCASDGELDLRYAHRFLARRASLRIPTNRGDNRDWHSFATRPLTSLATPKKLQLIFVPLVAFDRQGNRLGRGKGYYDRLLLAVRARHKNIAAVGVGWQFQEQNLEPKAYDQPLDYLVTEQQILRTTDPTKVLKRNSFKPVRLRKETIGMQHSRFPL